MSQLTDRGSRGRRLVIIAAILLLLSLSGVALIYVLFFEPDKPTARQLIPNVRQAPATTQSNLILASRKSNSISGVKSLRWNAGRENTFAGALESALAPTPHPADYATIMGGSGLAFRMRWIDRQPGKTWNGAAPTGTMPYPLEAIEKSTGWKLRQMWVAPQRRSPEEAHILRVTASIDRGIPVIGYEPNLNCAAICGYDEFGRILLMKDHYNGDAEGRFDTRQITVNFVFPESWSAPLSSRQMLIDALTIATAQWTQLRQEPNGNFHFYLGGAAYDQWLADVSNTSTLSDEQLFSLFFVNWWTFTSLVDARAAAIDYLNARKSILNSDAQQHIEQAISAYGELATTGKLLIDQKRLFQGRWTRATFKDWTDDVRNKEREVIRRFRDLDDRAIRFLRLAQSP